MNLSNKVEIIFRAFRANHKGFLNLQKMVLSSLNQGLLNEANDKTEGANVIGS